MTHIILRQLFLDMDEMQRLLKHQLMNVVVQLVALQEINQALKLMLKIFIHMGVVEIVFFDMLEKRQMVLQKEYQMEN